MNEFKIGLGFSGSAQDAKAHLIYLGHSAERCAKAVAASSSKRTQVVTTPFIISDSRGIAIQVTASMVRRFAKNPASMLYRKKLRR